MATAWCAKNPDTLELEPDVAIGHSRDRALDALTMWLLGRSCAMQFDAAAAATLGCAEYVAQNSPPRYKIVECTITEKEA